MKRRKGEHSSFDLFLDTICNTFGGIVFLAILLAIMIQNRSIRSSAERIMEQPSPDEYRTMILRLDKLSAEHDSLKAVFAALPERTQAADPELATAKEKAAAAEAELADALTERTKMGRRLAERLAANAAQQRENAGVLERLKDLQQDLGEAQQKYVALIESKKETLRLPNVRSTQAASILVLVRGQDLFLASEPSLYGHNFNTSHVTTSQADDGIIVDRIPGTGWSLKSMEGRQKVVDMVRKAKRNGYVVTAAVWPDSYSTFSSIRETMVTQGVNYQLWPQSENQSLIVVVGAGKSRVQ